MPAPPSNIAGPVAVLTLLASYVVFRLGFTRAIMIRARSDLKNTKAAVPVLRKGFWAAVRRWIKFLMIVGIGALILAAWAVRGDR